MMRTDAPVAASRVAPPAGLSLRAMAPAHLDRITAIEMASYAFPWTRGNFTDSLASGYPAQWLVDAAGECIGYYVALIGVQECHLLNLTVAPEHRGRGHGRWLLRHLADERARAGDESLWLEVRESNRQAQALYQRMGFQLAGRRRGYYPAPRGEREDALVMSLDLRPTAGPR